MTVRRPHGCKHALDQAWEAGVSYPGTDSLHALIACFVEAGGFARGREGAEAEALWSAALHESPRHRPLFDAAWFAGLLANQPAAEPKHASAAQAAPTAGLTSHRATRLIDWGDGPDVLGFLGRVCPDRVANRYQSIPQAAARPDLSRHRVTSGF